MNLYYFYYYEFILINEIKIYWFYWGLGIGDWGLGIGDWAQSPIPNPQSPSPFFIKIKNKHKFIIIKK